MGPELDQSNGESGTCGICGLRRFGICRKDAEDGGYPGRAFFSHGKNANYRQALDQQLALKKQALSPVLEISDTAFIIRMLEKNHGLSFLPYLAVERYPKRKNCPFTCGGCGDIHVPADLLP